MAPVFIFLRPPPLNCDFVEPTMKFLCATVWKQPQKCLGAEAGDVMDSSAGKPWVSEMDPLQVSMAERTNRRKHCGNPVILQHWSIINTQRWGRKPFLILKSMLRAVKEVHSTHSCSTSLLFFVTEYFLLLSPLHSEVFLTLLFAMSFEEKLFFDCWIYFLYIFQMFRETWRLMHYHTMRSMDQGMDGGCWSVVNFW